MDRTDGEPLAVPFVVLPLAPSLLGNGLVLARLYCREVPMLSASARLPYRPSRVLVGGTSGSGKTTLAGRMALMIGAAQAKVPLIQQTSTALIPVRLPPIDRSMRCVGKVCDSGAPEEV